MADEQDKQQPSLELPGIFGRKRRQAAPAETEPEAEAAPEVAPEVAPETVVAPMPEPVTAPEPEPTAPAAPEVAHIPDPPDEDAPATTRRTRFRRGSTSAEAPQVREPVPVGAPPLFAEEAERSTTRAAPVDAAVDDGTAPGAPTRSRPSLPSVPLPSLGGYGAAATTGLVVGLLLVGLTFGALRGCEEVRGTATCGGGVGTVLLVVIMAMLIALGGVILKAFKVPDPTSTSFLAMAMVAVVSLLFLLDVLLSPWMLLVLPLLTIATYAAAQWVTTAFVDAD